MGITVQKALVRRVRDGSMLVLAARRTPILSGLLCVSCFSWAWHGLPARGSTARMAVPLSQDEWGAPKVQVQQKEGRWSIDGLKNRVELNPSDLQMTVHAGGQDWSMMPSFSGDLIVEKAGKMFAPPTCRCRRKTDLPLPNRI